MLARPPPQGEKKRRRTQERSSRRGHPKHQDIIEMQDAANNGESLTPEHVFVDINATSTNNAFNPLGSPEARGGRVDSRSPSRSPTRQRLTKSSQKRNVGNEEVEHKNGSYFKKRTIVIGGLAIGTAILLAIILGTVIATGGGDSGGSDGGGQPGGGQPGGGQPGGGQPGGGQPGGGQPGGGQPGGGQPGGGQPGGGQPYDLPVSSRNQVLVLEDLNDRLADGSGRPIALSYDGNPWEATAQQDVEPPAVECISGGNCRIPGRRGLAAGIKDVKVPDLMRDVDNPTRAARLFQQATFGANKAQLDGFNGDERAWITSQIAIPPTLMREYYRARTSPRRKSQAGGDGTLWRQCEVGSRWHRYLFNNLDTGSQLVISIDRVPGKFALHIGGVLRGEMSEFQGVAWSASLSGYPRLFTICFVSEFGGGFSFQNEKPVRLAPLGGTVNRTCSDSSSLLETLHNPAIELSNPSATTTQVLGANDAQWTPVPGSNGSYILTALNAPCQERNEQGIAHLKVGDEVYRYDPRLKLVQNTLDKPAKVNASGALTCPLVSRNHQNKPTCRRAPSCTPPQFTSAPFQLNDTTLRLWFESDRHYVYYIKNLRLDGPYAVSPCNAESSRWLSVGATCTETSGIDALTRMTIRSALNLAAASSNNPYTVDITLSGTNCTASTSTIGMVIRQNGVCYQHVHPHHLDVIDFSRWVLRHDGNQQAFQNGKPNPISKWAELQGVQYLEFPAWHSMENWNSRQRYFTTIGRYGEQIDFSALPTNLQTVAMARAVGAAKAAIDSGFQACGSGGEASNSLIKGNRYTWPEPTTRELKIRQMDWPIPRWRGKSILWFNHIYNADDQLRQRVAWSMFNWLVIADGGSFAQEENEPWANFYDILVRHALGNYRDIMRDVAYSPMMANYLSFRGNKAFAYNNKHPDENFARELQQLFSIGLWQLNDDGTVQKDSRGDPIPTYTNEDIQTQARIWTGHDRQQLRSNTERPSGTDSMNRIDPLQIKPIWRDPLPKMNLYGGHIGDGYPLCEDQPPRHWMHPGARFEYSGNSSVEGDEVDRRDSSRGWNNFPRLRPAVGSPLHSALCVPQLGVCTFPDEVVLNQELSCAGTPNAQECIADRIVVVEVVNPNDSTRRFYTYRRKACITLTFFNNGIGRRLQRTTSQVMCGNPNLPIGLPVCCRTNGTRRREQGVQCLFANERVTYATNAQRCQELRQRTTSNPAACKDPSRVGGSDLSRSCARNGYQWIDNECRIKVQILSPSGKIGVVDELGATDTYGGIWRKDGANTFRVKWQNGEFPTASTTAEVPIGCETVATSAAQTLVCDITRVTREPVYRLPSDLPSYKEHIELHVAVPGSPPTDATHRVELERTDGLRVWVPSTLSEGSDWTTEVVIELPPFRTGGQRRFLLNMKSIVYVGDSSREYGFRNPPHFMPLFGKYTRRYMEWNSDKLWLPEAKEEVEALLTHLFEHNSTAPFICYRLAQHMVTSNPSPRYMRVMVEAFRTGYYQGIGTGVYGDMQATVAALLLDREARNPILSAFSTYGMLRDPLLKIISVMKALDYRATHGQEIVMYDLFEKIGVEAFRSGSVFGFYEPDFRPAGVMSEKGLSAPQSQILDGPNLVSWLNGMFSLVDYGLTTCNGGFAYWSHPRGRSCRSTVARSYADGHLTYVPRNINNTDEVIGDLNLLLLQGRLSNQTHAHMRSDFEKNNRNFNRLLKLFLLSTEFHVTNLLTPNTKQKRADVTEIPSQGRRAKFIVVLYKSGGLDSFNMIVPFSGCGSHDLYSEYQSVRGADLSLTASQLNLINVTPGTQPCSQFGVHSAMPKLTQMYRDSEALFVANIGGLVQPMTLADYYGTSGNSNIKEPPSLYSHNGMTQVASNGDALNASATGILGRIARSLQDQGYRSEVISMSGNRKFLEGSLTPYTTINPRTGVVPFRQYAEVADAMGNFTQFEIESSYGTTYQSSSLRSIRKLENLHTELENVQLNTTFSTPTTNRIAEQFRAISELIKLRGRLGTERGVFYVNHGGYDTHANNDISHLLAPVDEALDLFKTEMVAQGIWDDVVVVQSSEFGRTLVGNGQGTDHAWGGNTWIAGGAVRGGQILGEYPTRLTPEMDVVFNSRGRVLPTRGWESIWYGIAQWFGVLPTQMADVLPNAKNFMPPLHPVDKLYDRNELFR